MKRMVAAFVVGLLLCESASACTLHLPGRPVARTACAARAVVHNTAVAAHSTAVGVARVTRGVVRGTVRGTARVVRCAFCK